MVQYVEELSAENEFHTLSAQICFLFERQVKVSKPWSPEGISLHSAISNRRAPSRYQEAPCLSNKPESGTRLDCISTNATVKQEENRKHFPLILNTLGLVRDTE